MNKNRLILLIFIVSGLLLGLLAYELATAPAPAWKSMSVLGLFLGATSFFFVALSLHKQNRSG
jgi:hypothetical protein